MNFARLFKIAALVVVVVIALSPGIAYLLGLQRAGGRPEAAKPSSISSAEIQAAWSRCGEQLPMSVQRLNPWQLTVRFLFGDESRAGPGESAAHQVAAKHNLTHAAGTMGWWHLSDAALTIWITRHWSAEEIAATLVRDRLCM